MRRSDDGTMGTLQNSCATEQERWEAVRTRNRQADGRFLYGVVTTGVYCRPVCASRLPKRDNVRFFDTHEDAERAGFRPCKRCAPDAPAAQDAQHAAVIRACQLLREAEELPTLAELAHVAGFSPAHFQRVFKKIVGITPKQYAVEQRLQRVRDNLPSSASVTEAIYDAGFASNSRFYANAPTALGMEPSTYRHGGTGTRIRFAVTHAYIGWVLIAATEKGICAIEFADDPAVLPERLRARFSAAELVSNDPGFAAWVAQVLAFLESPGEGLDLPLDIRGTAFQQRVWQALREIPAGSTASYSEIAARLGVPHAARAVARACAANPIAAAIPCHRVVRRDGGAGGYRWGTERKRVLLAREMKERDA